MPGESVTPSGLLAFADCPPGLFVFNGMLCFKSEYSSNPGQPDAYCVDNGEYFWGGTRDLADRRALLVEPRPTPAPLASAAPGYVEAFYDLASLMGIGARTLSPREVWEREMRPRILAALAPAAAPEGEPQGWREGMAYQIAQYNGPVVSFDVREPYYLASCDKCGWVGSSEQSPASDEDCICPRCMSSGADCGKVAERLATPPPAVEAATVERDTYPTKYHAFIAGMEAAAEICGSLAETTYDDADAFEAATGCEASIMRVVREQRALTPAQPAVEAASEGMALVPREPTEAMLEAAKLARLEMREGGPPGVVIAGLYRAMLAASPSATGAA